VNKAIKEDCSTARFVAAEQGYLLVVVVQYLVQQGANKDKVVSHGHNPLFIAAQQGHLAVVQYLVQEGVERPLGVCAVSGAARGGQGEGR
jgi:ankyrin repeat protein